MLISFQNMTELVVPHCRGGEKEFYKKAVDVENNQILMGRLAPGASIGPHTHEGESETIYYISGTGRMLYDGKYEPVVAGTCHHCPPDHIHSLENTGDEDLVFFAVIPKH